MDSQGYVQVKAGTPETTVEGVFAAGDVQDKEWRQVRCSFGSCREHMHQDGGLPHTPACVVSSRCNGQAPSSSPHSSSSDAIVAQNAGQLLESFTRRRA